MTIPKTWQQWAKALVGAVVGSAAHSILSQLGLTGAQALGADVKPLNLKQLGGVAIMGAIVGACLYLAKSPVPNGEDKSTV